jgi:hypothetical protein
VRRQALVSLASGVAAMSLQVMNGHAQECSGLLEDVRVELVKRLRARRSEIQEAIFARVQAMSGTADESENAEYMAGLRAAVIEALDYAVTSIEQGEGWAPPIPSAAVAQARRAARHGVSLDTVLRRYAAGDRQLAEFVMDEADRFPTQELRHLLRSHGLQVDRFMASVAAEYMDELERVARSPQQRLAESVERLLVGEPVDTTKLDYEFDGRWHLGLIALGVDAEKAVKAVADAVDRQLLGIRRGEQTLWAWLGGRRRLAIADLERFLSSKGIADISLAVGEPGRGLDGWRLTHRQAQAAMWVALRRPRRLTRYADDLLLAAALRDEVLARSLHEIYFLPLCGQRDGAVLRETLDAYLTSGRNAATAAAALKVDRHTVQRRLRKIEERLGRLLHTCLAELEVALRLQELGETADADRLPDAELGASSNGAPHRD